MKSTLLLLSFSVPFLFQTAEATKPKQSRLFAKVKHQHEVGLGKTTTLYLPQQMLRYWWDDNVNDWTLWDTTYNVYNSKGMLIETRTPNFKEVITYDAKGHETKRLFLNRNTQTETWDSSSQRVFMYDAQGNETQYIYAQYDNNLWVMQEAYRYTNYYIQNLLCVVTTESWVADTTYEYAEQVSYTYNNEVLCLAEFREWSPDLQEFTKVGLIGDIEWHQWSSDLELSLPEQFYFYAWQDTAYVLESRELYTYDSHNNETEVYSETWDGSVWAKDYGNKSLLTYNNNGALVQSIEQSFNQDSGYYVNDLKKVYSNFVTYTGVQPLQLKASQLSIYPNPATSVITVEISNDGLSETINFYNLMGQTVLADQIHSGQNKIDVSGLPKGIYIYKTQSGINGKLILE